MASFEDETFVTDDGSITCFNPETGEHYHNRAGAYTEALVNYVEPSSFLKSISSSGSLAVLDVCFGLGYNTWVLLEKVIKHYHKPFTVTVYAIENDPEILKVIPKVLKDSKFYDLKKYLDPLEHNIYYQTQPGWNETVIDVGEDQRIFLKFLMGDLRETIPKLSFDVDLIFHDPFSPIKIPQLWTANLFKEYYRLLESKQGRLLTYSSAGAVRGGLREAGFNLYRTASLGRKTGGTLASVAELDFLKSQLNRENGVFKLTDEEENYLKTRSSTPYRDLDFKITFEEILSNRTKELQKSTLPSAGRERILYLP